MTLDPLGSLLNVFNQNLLSAIIFAPLLGALWLYVFPKKEDGSIYRGVAFLWGMITFGLSCLMLLKFNSESSALQLREHASWIQGFGVHYSLGVDGISVFLVMLTTFLMPIVVLASHSVKTNLRSYLANMLLLETAMLGTLLALDSFLFYIFWEMMLFPMYFLIGIWGGPRRIYATLKFVLYTVFGSVLMLIALLYTVWQHAEQSGAVSFLIADLVKTNFSLQEEILLFAAFALAFGIKVPIFPFHTWLPDAHVEAPTGGSVVLAGVLLKMGLYGFIRFAYPLFPNGAEVFAPYLAILAVIGIVYGALVAWAQSDVKKLVAYSSVSHLGYCVLGFVAFNTISATGSIYQMLNHGISTGALFLLVGVLYDRRHTREISEYGGLASKVPVFAFLFLVFTLSSIALPLTNGFVGEFLILYGSFQTFPLITIVAVSGVVLGAIYMLTLYLKTMFGEIDEAKNGSLTDVNTRELVTLLPLLFMVFYMGIFPQKMLSMIEPSVVSYIQMVEERKDDLTAYVDDHSSGNLRVVNGVTQLIEEEERV
ncbi:MAG: NADH-quinone oxidoreductase subunit M [Deltaproteobacteria bacterium]|nr:NADH-quinone oxidoreductase subunit M [Deltaproteobacteria bacterium]